MNNQDYTVRIAANVSARDAFNSINRVSDWWAMHFEGHSEKLNDVFTVRFGETFVTFKIIDMVPDKKVVWQVLDCNLHRFRDKKEWKDTKVSFEITQQGDTTQVQFTHIGLVPTVECYEVCQKGWDQYAKQSLLKLITEGKGYPA